MTLIKIKTSSQRHLDFDNNALTDTDLMEFRHSEKGKIFLELCPIQEFGGFVGERTQEDVDERKKV